MAHAATKTEQVAELSKQGLGIREIANAIGSTPDSVVTMRHTARKRGCDIPQMKTHLTELEHKKIAEMRRNGSTLREISAEVGRSFDGIRRSLRLAGLAPSLNDEAPLKYGRLSRAICLADEKALRWMLEQVPEGGNLAETLVEIALDQYFEKGGAA